MRNILEDSKCMSSCLNAVAPQRLGLTVASEMYRLEKESPV